MLSRIYDGLRSGAWLTRERAIGYLVILTIGNLFGLGIALCRSHGWFIPAEPHFSTEFMGFYAGGRLVDQGHASLAYAPPAGVSVQDYIHSLGVAPAHRDMQRAIAGDPHLIFFTFFYPPVYWLFCAPVALLPYYVGFVLWVAASLTFFLFALRRVLGRWTLVLAAGAYLGFFENASVGENSFLTSGLLAFGLLQLEKRPVLAGILFGSLCYKPHFALPVGVMLLAGKHWRAMIAAALWGGGLCVLAGFIFGFARWVEYLGMVVPHASWMLRHNGFAYDIQVTTFSSVRLLGGPVWLADVAQIVTTLFAIASVFYASRYGSPEMRGAMLTASFPLILSVMIDYDLTICALAVAFFYRVLARSEALAWEKTATAAMFAMSMVSFLLRGLWHVPLDIVIVFAFMLVCVKRVRAERLEKAAT
ncbi:MAG: glycosyltransferase family 87 protein [Polyangiaceae bacterium]